MKVARVRRGLDQRELARRAGLTEGSYGRYERSERHIDVEVLSRVAIALETTIAAIVASAVNEQPQAFRFISEAEGTDVG